MPLRPYQHDALDTIATRYKAGINRQLVKLPTGMGKTAVFANVKDHLKLPGRVMVVVHRDELAEQAKESIQHWTEHSVGIEMGDRQACGETVVVAGVRTIGNEGSRRLKQFDPLQFGAVVVDEVHRGVAESYKVVYRHFRVFEDSRRLLLGVTATVNRSDDQPLGEIFQEIVYDYPMLQGIKEGWLADLIGVHITTGQNLDDVRKSVGDLIISDLSKKVDTDEMNDLAVREWLKHAKSRQTIVYCVDVKHAKNMALKFKQYGVAAEAIWGEDPYRKDKLDAHKKTHLQVITNCEILTEGYDDWQIGCILLARPTQSELLYTQMVGRGTRIPKGIDNLLAARKAGIPIPKEDCIILDMVHNTVKHSLVTLPSLFGLNKYTNTRGKKITQVLEEIEQAKAKVPLLDVLKIDDINNLQAYAQQISLFEVKFPEEIVKISDNQWRKVDNAYVLLLTEGSHLTVLPDMLNQWHVVGRVGIYSVKETLGSLEAAVKEADERLKGLGSRRMILCAKRELKSDNKPPSDEMLKLCKRLYIKVPPDATHGEVRRKIGQVLAAKKKRVA